MEDCSKEIDQQFEEKLKSFIEKTVSIFNQSMAKHLLKTLKKKKKNKKNSFSFLNKKKKSFKEIKDFNFDDFTPKQIAEQLTIIESFIFKNLNLREIASLNWSRKEKKKIVPTIVASSQFFNRIS